MIFYSCHTASNKTKVIWTFVDGFETKADSCLLERKVFKNSVRFRYFFDFKDRANFLEFKLLKNNLLVAGQDTFELYDNVKMKYKSDSIEVLKYETPDAPPGGQGCWIFSKELGMLGNGLFVGSKMVLSKMGDEIFNSNELAGLISSRFEFPPPPPYELENMNETKLKKNKNAP